MSLSGQASHAAIYLTEKEKPACNHDLSSAQLIAKHAKTYNIRQEESIHARQNLDNH